MVYEKSFHPSRVPHRVLFVLAEIYKSSVVVFRDAVRPLLAVFTSVRQHSTAAEFSTLTVITVLYQRRGLGSGLAFSCTDASLCKGRVCTRTIVLRGSMYNEVSVR